MSEPAKLLPPNATPLMRRLAAAGAQIERVPVPLAKLGNPWTCPIEILPYLAWAFSVDRWEPDWPEATQRRVVADAFYVHSHKGTIAGLRRVVEPYGYGFDITEWFQMDPEGDPGTFALNVDVTGKGISQAVYDEISALVNDAKPVSRHLVRLNLAATVSGDAYSAAAINIGETTVIYPFELDDVYLADDIYTAAALISVENTVIYPLEAA